MFTRGGTRSLTGASAWWAGDRLWLDCSYALGIFGLEMGWAYHSSSFIPQHVEHCSMLPGFKPEYESTGH